MFKDLKNKLRENFDSLSSQPLFYVSIDRDEIWELYLNGFEDPVERQEHNCNACKSFLRQWGGIVAIVDNKMVSIWDGIDVEGFEQPIHNIRRYIHSRPITNVFLNEFASIGTDKNHDSIRDVTWEHFHLNLPSKFVMKKDIVTVLGEKRTNWEVFRRALSEISSYAVSTVLDLISQGSLYRGNDYAHTINKFLAIQKEYEDVPEVLRDNFVWVMSVQTPMEVMRIKNSAIGTLLTDLSKDVDLDAAVASFERMVAPTNYKRPTALVTPRMVEQAKEKLAEMGVMGSLERRHANETDLNIEDIIFTDKSSSVTDVFQEISKETPINPRSLTKVEEVTIEDFIKNVVPTAKSIEVLLENRHTPNLVTLITAQDKEATSIFKWNNNFSWSYTGGITDSIKERVKAAGGRVDAILRVSLSWNNYDDLDIHAVEPDNTHIFYGSYKYDASPNSGKLDVDMNAGHGTTRTPVENIVWTDGKKMREGRYRVWVDQYSRRESTGQGYTVQIECNGETFEFSKDRNPIRADDEIAFTYTKKDGLVFDKAISSNTSSKDVWGMKTNMFIRVKKMMLSPNFWGGEVGNKHYFFFLEGAVSDEDARPFFNEFLKNEFTENRKVFEVLGSKLRVERTNNQLSGVGFSVTQRNDMIVRVDGNFKRIIKIKF